MVKSKHLLLLLKCDAASLCYQDVCLKHFSLVIVIRIVSIVIMIRIVIIVIIVIIILIVIMIVIMTSALIRSAVWRLWSALCRWSKFELSHSE